MKKINNIVLLTAALAASLACQKAEINEQKPQSEGRAQPQLPLQFQFQ